MQHFVKQNGKHNSGKRGNRRAKSTARLERRKEARQARVAALSRRLPSNFSLYNS